MLKTLRQYVQLVRAFGVGWVFFRVRYALRGRLGLTRRRAPQKTWEEIEPEFAADSSEARWLSLFRKREGIFGELPDAADFTSDDAGAREILAGRFRLFGWRTVKAGRFPDWHASTLEPARRAPDTAHWSALGDFAFGDIKNIWELSRWPWAFALARAWLGEEHRAASATARERFAERFWELAGDWLARNPPNSGVNWKCGQEAAFRLFAAVFARCAFDGAAATTPARLATWRRLVRATGGRIAANLDYALSQSNNHGVSECVGLLTAGALAGGAAGARWFARSERALRAQVAALVYRDGGFSQHSAVYHRVLLHDLLWADTAFRAAGRDTPAWLRDAGARAAEFLAALTDADNGVAHLYGANDGADILPIRGEPFADFRPVLRACARVFGANATPARADFARHFPDAGVFVARRGGISLLLRCATRFRHRATRDMLHLSVRWRGVPVVLNPGTFSYNPDPAEAFAAGLSSAFTHNTATCEDADQMERLGRFLHLPWPTGEARPLAANADDDGGGGGFETDAGESRDGRGGDSGECAVNNAARAAAVVGFEAVSHAYRARFGATHTRRVWLGGDESFLVEDVFESAAPRRWRLHWLLADGAGVLRVEPTDINTPAAPADVLRRWRGSFALEIPAAQPPEATSPADSGAVSRQTEMPALHCRAAAVTAPDNPAIPAIRCRVEWEIALEPAAALAPEISAVRAAPNAVRGWHSPHYQQLLPAWSLAFVLPPAARVTIRTRFTLGA